MGGVSPDFAIENTETGKILFGEIKNQDGWVEGDITRDPKRVREITFWFDQYYMNFFMWRPGVSGDKLLEHFNKYLKQYLD